MREDILKRINEELAAGRPAVLVTVLRTGGSTPRKAGSRMLVTRDGGLAGSIGGGLVEAWAIDRAARSFQSASSGLEHFAMNSSVAAGEGMACGGDMDLFIQYVAP